MKTHCLLRGNFIVIVKVFCVCNIYLFLASKRINFIVFIILLNTLDSLVEITLEELLDIFKICQLDLAIWTGTISSNSRTGILGRSSTQVVL